MVDTCVMCDNIVTEGTMVCSDCMHTFNQSKCQECHTPLVLIHSKQTISGDTLTINKLFHCENCLTDYEQNISYVKQHDKFKRKFWG